MILLKVIIFLLLAIYVMTDAVDYCPYGCHCPSIPVANCSYGDLTEIPREDFEVYMQDLDLSHNSLTTLEQHTLFQVFMPSVVNINLSHNNINYINMKSFIAVITIKQLDLSWNRIHHFNRRTIEYTPRLERLSLAGNPRIYISNTGGFLESKSLTHLNMSRSEFGFIPDVMFEELPHLRHLDLSHNRLTRLRPEVFSTLSQLEWLDLRYNHLDSQQLGILSRHIGHNVTIISDPQRVSPCSWPSDSLANCYGKDITDLPAVGFTPTITEVDLSYNKLIRLTKEAVDQLGKVSQLRVVTFSHNLIEHIDEDSFNEGLQWLEVDLSWNRLMYISPNTFLHNYYIQKVSLAGNMQLVLISSGNFLRAGPLLQLNMSHCGFSNVPDHTFRSVGNLRMLDLSHNNISALQPKALSELSQLNLLDVSYNHLTTLDTDTLSRLLDDENIETEIRNRMRRDVRSIIGLRNRMKRETTASIALRTDGNPWVCDCKMLEVYEWCKENKLKISVICQTPEELSKESWEKMRSENCMTTTTTTHYYPSTESSVIVVAFSFQTQAMWLSIVGGILVLSLVMLVIVTLRLYRDRRDHYNNSYVVQRNATKTQNVDSKLQRDIELKTIQYPAYKLLRQGSSDSGERHTTHSSTLPAPSPLRHEEDGGEEQRLSSNNDMCLV